MKRYLSLFLSLLFFVMFLVPPIGASQKGSPFLKYLKKGDLVGDIIDWSYIRNILGLCPGDEPPTGDLNDYTRISGNIVFMTQPELQVGGFGSGDNQLAAADTVKVDREGNIYAVDDVQNVIKVWSMDTCTGDVEEIITTEDIEAAGLSPLAEIRGIATGFDTKLYILDRDKKRDPKYRILMRPHIYSSDWVQLGYTEMQETPHDITVDRFGRIIIAEKKGTLEVLVPRGDRRDPNFGTDGILVMDVIDGLEVSSLKTVDTDRLGFIYVADKDNGRIIKISPRGDVVGVFGSQGEGEDQFREEVEGVGVDWRGNIYGRDESGNRYLVFAPNGTFLASFGERGFEPWQQENADEFVIDKIHRKFIIADNNNYRVSVHSMLRVPFDMNVFTEYDFPEATIVEPLWIAGGEKGSEPGTQFDEPNELAFDKNGNLWAGDVFNMRVQIYDNNGNFITTVGGEGSGDCEFFDPGT
ncbi:MAG: hypothetical protein D6828_03350, partial [Nitrospirae bacterium]